AGQVNGVMNRRNGTKGTNGTKEAVPKRTALVHLFSNGGMISFHRLNAFLNAHYSHTNNTHSASTSTSSSSSKTVTSTITTHLRVSGIILDSTPSYTANVNQAARALTTTIKNPVLSFLAGVFIRVFYLSQMFIDKWILGREGAGPILPARRELQDPKVWGCPRLYLYSKADDLIDWEGVQRHARETREAGVEVREKCWETSAHVQHLRAHPEEYKALVDAFLEDIQKKQV
ncbi:hypothetical protein HK102_008860, partial [Quaeritorhiza haematococci]